MLGRTQRAQAVALGRASAAGGGGELYEDLLAYEGLRPPSGVAVFQYQAPVYYANQSLFKRSLYRATGLDPVQEKARRRKLEKKKKNRSEKEEAEPTTTDVAAASGRPDDAENGVAGKEAESDAGVTKVLMPSGKKKDEVAGGVHSLVLDCSAVLFLDTAGVNALKEVRKDYQELGVGLLLARCSASVLDTLERGGYSLGPEEPVFFSIEDAVRYAQNVSNGNGDKCDTYC